jgi:hypothetical protein
LSESGFSGFWDFQDYTPQHHGVTVITPSNGSGARAACYDMPKNRQARKDAAQSPILKIPKS